MLRTDSNGKQIRDIKYRLEPDKWTEVPDEVIAQLKHKYGNSRYSTAPDSLPKGDGSYSVDAGKVRAERINSQYLIEFAN